MTLPITSLYAALFTVLVIILANIVSANRARAGVSILHGDDMTLALWIRRHGNLVENLPLALVMLGLCEASGLPGVWLHVMGIGLLVARLFHVAGLTVDRPYTPLRLAGGIGTQLMLLAAAGWLIWSWF